MSFEIENSTLKHNDKKKERKKEEKTDLMG